MQFIIPKVGSNDILTGLVARKCEAAHVLFLLCFSRKLEEEGRARSLRLESEQQLKMRRRMEREERRRQMKLKAKFQTDEEEMAARIAVEERKLLIAQRKLESIRLLDELLERVKVNRIKLLKREHLIKIPPLFIRVHYGMKMYLPIY